MKTLKLLGSATAALFLAMGLEALAADLGGPRIAQSPTGPATIETLRPSIWQGCFADAAVGGVVARADGGSASATTIGLGLGCDLQQGRVVYGGRLGYDIGREDFRALELGARVGLTINSAVLLYGKLGLTMDGKEPDFSNSILVGGGGIETVIGFSGRTTLFLEIQRDLVKWGDARDVSDYWNAKVGARVRF